MLYKYPQGAFPYDDLVAENGRRKGHNQPEYELVDTGLFNEGRYFDVTVEYAKGGTDDILMRVTVANRGAGRRADPRAAASLGAQHVELGPTGGSVRDCTDRKRTWSRPSDPAMSRATSRHCSPSTSCSARTRPTPGASSASQSQGSSRTASTTT